MFKGSRIVVLVALAAALPAAVAHAGRPAAIAPAARTCSTISAGGGDVVRIYALRGVGCGAAVKVARVAAISDAPKPWHCLTGTGQTYRGKPVSFACGYGSRGPVMKRAHAFVAVQAHTSG